MKARIAQLWQQVKRDTRRRLRRFLVWISRNVPPGLRFLLGLLLICGGVLGFLPVLGFWMIPLGIAVAALDTRIFWRWARAHLVARRDLWRLRRNGPAAPESAALEPAGEEAGAPRAGAQAAEAAPQTEGAEPESPEDAPDQAPPRRRIG